MKPILLGLDPGVRSGIALYHPSCGYHLRTVGYSEVVATVRELLEGFPEDMPVKIYMEDPTQNKPVFPRKGLSALSMQKIAQNVGSHKLIAQQTYEALIKEGYEVIKVKPTKFSGTKLNRERIKILTGYEGKSSQHSRDALMTIAGR